MRHLTALTLTAALAGAAMLLTSGAAAATAETAASWSQAGVQSDARFIRAHAPGGQRMDWTTRGESCADGGGGGGGDAAAAAGIAGTTMTGVCAAEQTRAAVEQDAAIAQNARRHHDRDPQSQTWIGRGGRVCNRS